MGYLKLTAVASAALLLSGSAFAQQRTVAPVRPIPLIPNESVYVPSSIRTPAPPPAKVTLANPLNIGGGATSTGLFGFYDYQSNGMSPGWVWVSRTNPNRIFLTYMLSTAGDDSITISVNRRVGYATSTDGGKTWQATQDIGSTRLGFPYMGVSDQYALIAAHGNPDNSGIHVIMYATDTSSTEFTPVQNYPVESTTGRIGTDNAGVIWPAFVVNPKKSGNLEVIASLSPPTGEGQAPLQYSNADLTNSLPTWSALSDSMTGATSGGNYVIAASSSGRMGILYNRAFTDQGDIESPGLYLIESTDGGGSWSTPTHVFSIDPNIDEFGDQNGDADTLFGGSNMDLVYSGDVPHVVFSTSVSGLYVTEGIYHWDPTNGLHRIALADSTMGIGVIAAPQAKEQPNMRHVDYPSLSASPDGKHILSVFQAAAQFSSDGETMVSSEGGFAYFRLWGVGSNDGGKSWSKPYLIQDFAGDASDSASIEYPSLDEVLRTDGSNFQYSLAFQARRHPGMFAFVSTSSSGSSDAGPIETVYQYFQRASLDESHFGPFVAGVNNEQSAAMKASVKLSPNPATSSAKIEYTLPTSGDVTVKIYNTLGVQVATPVQNASGYAGSYTIPVDVTSLPAGAYRVVVSQNGVSVSQPLNVIH